MEDRHIESSVKRSLGKNLQETLLNIKNAKKELEAAFDSLSDIVILVDFEGKITRCNRAIENWNLGHVKRLEGIRFHELFHPDCYDKSCHLTLNWDVAQQKLMTQESYDYQVFDNCLNRFIQVQFSPISRMVPVRGAKGAVFAVVTIKDVTLNKVNEIQLAQTSAEFKSIFQVLLDQYIRLNHDGTILDVQTNRNSETSIFSADSIGKNIDGLVPPAIHHIITKAINDVRETNRLITLEYPLGQRENKKFFEARLLPLMENQIIMIIQDNTEKKKLEAVAEAVDMMEKLGYIFSAIRHEIGNPVNAIKVAVSVLKKNIGQFSDEKVFQYAERVLSDISRIEYLLKSFKSFTMFEDLVITNVPVKDFLENFISLLNDELEKKSISIQLNVFPGNDTVSADPRALHQVLLNIVGNAMDALKNTENKTIEIITGKNHGKIWLIIKDNGQGFDEDQLKHLFKPFFTTKADGTGLGLVIVKKILTRMHGDIEIESTVNIGTTVSISLPEGTVENV